MNRRSLENMRTDRRLTGRAGWISPEELEREASGLPDVSEKIAEEEEEPAREETDAEPPEADPLLPS